MLRKHWFLFCFFAEDTNIFEDDIFTNGIDSHTQHDGSDLDDYLNGSTAVALSYQDPTSPARVLKKFTNDHDLPKVKGIVIDGNIIDGSEFAHIANLPSKDESLAKFVALLQSPLMKLIWALKSPMSDMTNMLNNLKDEQSKK